MNSRPRFRHATWFAAVVLAVATSRAAAESSPSFINDVIPVLTRFGCNTGGCHGKLAGKNGFRLSLRGYAPDLDYETIVREARGRRINPAAPENSLLIRKATGRTPHGGGQRFVAGSAAERILVDWITAGASDSPPDEPRPLRIEIEPTVATLSVGESQPLRVTVVYDNKQRRDVTWLTQFASSDSGMLDVNDRGQVKAVRNGEAVVRATFHGQVEIATLTIPYDATTDPQWYAARNNAVDDHVFAKLAALRIEPSQLCDEATFMRRAYLDAIGTLPTPAEVQAFLSDTKADKRSRLVDQLLKRPEFVDFWALQLGDLLQNRKERDHDVRGSKGVRAMHQWLRQQLVNGRSWRDIATAVLLAEGSCDQNPAVGYYIVTVGEKSADQSEVADSVAQAFLGIRIGCARCHNHPLEKYTQDDFYHFAAFFSRVALDRKKPEEAATRLVVGTRHMLNLQRQIVQQQQKLSQLQTAGGDRKPIDEATKRIADLKKQIESARQAKVETRQPRTGHNLKPRPLDRSTLKIAAGQDPRIPLVRWMTDPANENFSGAMVNRLWKHFLGVGLVEPVDDLRATNPPSNRELWKLLNREFVASGYDLRHMMRFIMNSRTYQLSSETRPANFRDDRLYSHFYARRLPAEVLLDAICDATGEPEAFPGYPLGVRAIQVPDPAADSYFLTLFGRSERTTACACERSGDVTLPQLLHLQNSDGMYRKLKAPTGRLTKLLAEQPDNNRVIRQLYLSALSRPPTGQEREVIAKLLKDVDRDESLLDVFWALLNSKEFAFQH
jgi:hypothetical protein